MIDSSLPLTDIHRHLDGNIRAQTILDLGREFNIALPATTLDTLRPHVQVTSLEPDLVSFLAKLDWGVKVLASLEACRRVAYENVEEASRVRCSATILTRPATPGGISPSTRAKRPARKVSGRPYVSWARSASAMGLKR